MISEVASYTLEKCIASWIGLACEDVLSCIEYLLSMTDIRDIMSVNDGKTFNSLHTFPISWNLFPSLNETFITYVVEVAHVAPLRKRIVPVNRNITCLER